MKPAILPFLAATLAGFGDVSSPPPTTLLEFAGASSKPARLSEAALVVVDAQRFYVDGKLRLAGIDEAVAEIARLLTRARELHTPVVHIVQQGRADSPIFTSGTPAVEIIPALAPIAGETVIVKTLPNGFAGTSLDEALRRSSRKELIVVGFMTHNCVSSTVRSALDHGYRSTVVATACATRDLAGAHRSTIPASVVQEAELAALRDRSAAVAQSAAEIED
ncbi:cysteine hydrolase [Opitutaceae bacterium EW11]|nr:cysteine hydrolase [Opitutaceae bacterium EW11]